VTGGRTPGNGPSTPVRRIPRAAPGIRAEGDADLQSSGKEPAWRGRIAREGDLAPERGSRRESKAEGRETPPGEDPARLAEELLAWYRVERRDLPWRGDRDPWSIWVSEVMLQQTRVEAVRERHPAFLERFPDPGSLAAGTEAEVLKAWEGLGYYRRARLLREGARRVQEDFGGRIPRDPDALASIPGIGPYTKGAILAIAFDLPEPAIDGNVERVVSRLLAIRTDPRKAPARKRIREFCEDLLRHGAPGDLVQALMELGALRCKPGTPLCPGCPWNRPCLGRREGIAGDLPRRPPRPRPHEVRTALFLVPGEGGLLARRLPASAINAGQWTLPGPGMPKAESPPGSWIRKNFGIRLEDCPRLGTFRHAITNHRIEVEVRVVPRSTGARLPGHRFLDPGGKAVWTTASRKALKIFADRYDRESSR